MNHADPSVDQADMQACAREAIEFLGQVQPHGFLIECSPDWIVRRVSANMRSWFGRQPEQALGAPLSDLFGPRLIHDLRGELQLMGERPVVGRLYDRQATGCDRSLDLAVHRAGETIVIEGEPATGEPNRAATAVPTLLAQLRHEKTVEGLAGMIVRQVRALTQFDRIMVYRFHHDGSGEVIAESKATSLPSFKGLRYPASDIPPQARALYLRNPIRLIADVGAQTVDLIPRIDPMGRPLDLSMADLRAVSPVHIEYLRNMGVAASMSISIVVGGELWGLIAAHHQHPRRLSMAQRESLSFFGQMASSILEGISRAEELARQDRARNLHNRLLSQFSGEARVVSDILPQLAEAQDMLAADGLATWIDGNLQTMGATPDSEQIGDLIRFLNRAVASRIYSTQQLPVVHPEAEPYAEVASGVLAVPVSRRPRDYILFFRRELPRQVVWAGEPVKVAHHTTEGTRFSPRKSFDAWRETVRHQSAPWTQADLNVAEALRISFLELMLQVTDDAEKQRKVANDQQDLLIAELNHRVRNILNLIVGLVRQCSDDAQSVTDFSRQVSERVYALARAHDQIASSGWGPRSVRNMIRVEAGAYLADKADRITITGDEAAIQPDAFATLALVVHELITNSAKYGAFRDSHGGVDIALTCDPDLGLIMDWVEHGGAPVKAPMRRGFGSTIIERAIPHELGGDAMLDFATSGLRARFVIPSVYLADCAPGADTDARIDTGEAAGAGRIDGSVLLVEDNLLIALEVEDSLGLLGASEVHVASSVASALTLIARHRIDFALLDYNLGREQSVRVADELIRLDIPFVFATGYGDTAMIAPQFRDRPILTKPYTHSMMMHAYGQAISHAARHR